MSIQTFFEVVFYYYGIFGLIVASLMLVGAWLVLRFSRQKV